MSSKFKPGQSGNPAGKPKGARDKRSAFRDLLHPHAKELIAKTVEMAKKGDATCLRLCLERLVPALKPETIPIALPALVAAGSVTDQGRAVLAAVASGELSPERAGTLLSAIAAQARAVETDELARRIEALEAARR